MTTPSGPADIPTIEAVSAFDPADYNVPEYSGTSFYIRWNGLAFRLEIGNDPGPRGLGHTRAALVLSPQMAKSLAGTLAGQVAIYEEAYGPINLDVLPTFRQPSGEASNG